MPKNKKVCPYCDPYGSGIEHFAEKFDGFSSFFDRLFPPVGMLTDRFIGFLNLVSILIFNFYLRILITLHVMKEVDLAETDPEMHMKYIVIMREAKHRNIPVKIIKILGRYTSFFSIYAGGKKKFFQGAPFYEMGKILEIDCDDKYKLKQILKANNFPYAEGKSFWSQKKATLYAEKIGFPLVVKPRSSSLSRHITCNIKSKDELQEAIRIVKIISQEFVVEKHVEGDVYRITVVGNHFVACCLREAPNVIGDGTSTIKELIEIKNTHPYRGEFSSKNFGLHKIHLTPLTDRLLSEQNLKFSSKLKKNQKIYLHNKVILSCGADIHDRTGEIHPENVSLFEKVAQLCKIDLIGFDFLCQDISRPHYAQKCAIIEANSLPSIEMHHFPSTGEKQDIAKHIFDHYEKAVK